MRTEEILYFTPLEEEIVMTLGTLGIQKNVGKVLVYLARKKVASTHEIERCTNLRQSEVSHAVNTLMDEGWVSRRENKTGIHGRPTRIYTLIAPVNSILDSIEKKKLAEVAETMDRIKALREHVELHKNSAVPESVAEQITNTTGEPAS